MNESVPLSKQFLKYVSFNVLSMIGLSCYILADTYFISAGVGPSGIAALNLVLPAYSLLNGAGLMLGMGASTRYSILRSEGKNAEADMVFSHAVCVGVSLGVLFTLAGIFLSHEISGWLGASGPVRELSSVYLKTILSFSLVFIVNNILVCFIRNDGQPNLSMAAMLAGSLSNVVLDYVFIFPWGLGMFGAAFATGLAPVISLLVLSSHFIRRRHHFHFTRIRFSVRLSRGFLALGLPSLITELSSGVVIFIFNLVILRLAGDLGVAAYGIIANLALIAASIFTGVAQGIQPIASNSFGGGRLRDAVRVFHWAALLALGLGAALLCAGLFAAGPIVAVFNHDGNETMANLAQGGLPLYFTAFPLMGINIVASSFFSSIARPIPSFWISICRGCIAVVPCVFLLSFLLSMTGVWVAVPVAEFLTLLCTIIFYHHFKKRCQL